VNKGIIHSWHTDKIVCDTVENNKIREPNRDQYIIPNPNWFLEKTYMFFNLANIKYLLNILKIVNFKIYRQQIGFSVKRNGTGRILNVKTVGI